MDAHTFQHRSDRVGMAKKRANAKKPTRFSGGAQSRSDHEPDIRINKAQQAWAEKRYDEAIWFYERALERAPTNAVLLVDVARAYAMRFRFAEAEVLVDRACSLYPDDARLQAMLGRSYQQLQQFDHAIACFRRALTLDPTSADRARTLYDLAQMYERLHRLDEARDAAKESLTLAPDQPVLRYMLALIDRRAQNLAGAQARLEELVEDKKAPSVVVADAWYQLAALYDKAGQYTEAFGALTEAKKKLDQTSAPIRYDADIIRKVSLRTFRTLTADHCERWSAAGSTFSPLAGGIALLTSHPRSGTTLLEQVLDAHPGVKSADEIQVMTEVVYIPLCHNSPVETPVPQILDATPDAVIQKTRRAYLTAMEGAIRESVGDRILLDKNPAMTGLLPVIARVFPEMKVIFALRDPRDVVLSCYMQQLPLNPVSVRYLTLQETAQEYASTMRSWLKIREILKNPWLEVRYEETVADLPAQARRVLEFLELPWADEVLAYRTRAEQKHVHSPTYEAVTKPLYTSSIGRWRNYASQFEPCLETLKPFLEAFGYDA